jgi:hypothetical protein
MIKNTQTAITHSKPDLALMPKFENTQGIQSINQDFAILGFKRRPHENTIRQKMYELNRAGNFFRTFDNNNHIAFMDNFNKAYEV